MKARFGAWYELFPRSWGGLKAVEEQVPAIADLGFDVLYLLPIHPIGRNNRKGRNNTLVAGPDDPGSPVRDRRRGGRPRRRPPGARHLATTCAACAPPRTSTAWTCAWTSRSTRPPTTRGSTEHPEWFHQRPDGTLKYAENPPKRYQDIYNFNWDTRGLARPVGRLAATSSCTGSTPA